MKDNDSSLYTMVTGSSQGLGRAIAEECAGLGRNLCLVALPNTGLPEVAEIIRRTHGVMVEILEADLTESNSARRVMDWIESCGVRLGTLVNNAGTGYNGLFRDSSLEDNDATIQLNVLALVRLTHLLLPVLTREPQSSILNVASLAAYFPMPYMPVYSPSKSFVVNFSLALREELRGSGVNVSVLCPNGIRTNRSCRRQIDAQGLAGRVTCFYPDEVARYALKGLMRQRAVIVPGWINRILQLVAGLVPKTLIFRVVGRHWGTVRPGKGPATFLEPARTR